MCFFNVMYRSKWAMFSIRNETLDALSCENIKNNQLITEIEWPLGDALSSYLVVCRPDMTLAVDWALRPIIYLSPDLSSDSWALLSEWVAIRVYFIQLNRIILGQPSSSIESYRCIMHLRHRTSESRPTGQTARKSSFCPPFACNSTQWVRFLKYWWRKLMMNS